MRSALVFAIAALALALPSAGNAAPPSNNDFANATSVASLPLSETVDLSEATLESGEPGGGCWPIAGSAWYKLEPTQTTTLQITSSAGFDRAVNVYRQFGSGFGGLSFIACGYQGNATPQLQGGGTYYVQVGQTTWWSSGGPLDLTLDVLPAPPNDAFADAHALGSLGASEVVNMIASTVESGEPTPAGIGSFQGTAWWSFVAPESGSMLINQLGCCGNPNVGVYTGNSLGSLTEVPATRAYGRTIFTATAGQTYRFQLGHNGLYGDGRLGISIDRAPAPSAGYFMSPGDPTSYDTISFYGSGYDPAAMPIDSWTWDFGDGGSTTGQSVNHRYFTDGTYPVTITITTIDGRTASSTTNVVVKTHDVAITKLVVPQSAQAGKTKTITVEVRAARYDENVTIQLWRSIPGGYEPVGNSMQLVSARKQGTVFTFSYTFRPEDKAVGKVTFKAVATINGRDALPADNEVVALPTKVS